MSACSVQAMSQVGCRLMVASRANTSRPRAPAACGDIACAFATNAAMSSDVDVGSGSVPARRVGASLCDFGLIGSPAMRARPLQQALCGTGLQRGQCAAVTAARLPRAALRSDQFATAFGGFCTGTNSETGPGSVIAGGALLGTTGARSLAVSLRY